MNADASPSPDHLLGKFEPSDAKRILEEFERQLIRFEVAADHSELLRPGRTQDLFFGMYPEGSKLAIYVDADASAKADAIVQQLFPVFKDPA
jgi:hypothetical protein